MEDSLENKLSARAGRPRPYEQYRLFSVYGRGLLAPFVYRVSGRFANRPYNDFHPIGRRRADWGDSFLP
jgi:hypothetical protein